MFKQAIMKRVLAILAVLLFGVSFALPTFAQSGYDWDITSFHADIMVASDSSVDVKETIDVDFHVYKHGIYRDIPVKYRNDYNQDVTIGLDVLGVLDENGVPVDYELSRQGAYQRLKIGDADRTITGEHTYVIEYKVNRAVRFFNDHDELYWNVTGNEWEVPITKSSAAVYLPFAANDEVKTICYTGETGSKAQDCTGSVQSNEALFAANDFLTIAVSWPKGLVTEPAFLTKVGWFLGDNFGVFLPFIALALGYWVWSKRGRDPLGRGIVRQYEAPDKLSPAEVSYLVRQYFKPDDISAEIVSLANKGFIKIREIKKDGWIKNSYDYELELVKDLSEASLPQRTVLDAFFNEGGRNKRLISSLPSSFYKEVEKIKGSVWASMERHKYFVEKPEYSRIMGLVGVFAAIVPLYLLAAAFAMRIDMVVGGIISFAILFAFAWQMPKRTEAGVAAYQYALGFKEYIAAAETDRVKWEETQNLFFEMLPYAMAFGIADKWAKAFEGKLNQQPDWYSSSSGHAFSPVYFSHSMNSFSTATTSHSSPPSSNSSGFSGGSSGGGGGGGGGGSW